MLFSMSGLELKLQAEKTGRKGHLFVATKIYEVSPSLCMLELCKVGGDTLEFHKVATSLNSNECFLLQSGSSLFTWRGNQSTFEQQQLAAKVAEFLKVRNFLERCKIWSKN
ncbi:hypothetical protein ACSBR2_034336 [Camellia fascicularis]